ncbi:MAG: DegQ family serine endoprotease [Candidatus Latescibacterota bacterium]
MRRARPHLFVLILALVGLGLAGSVVLSERAPSGSEAPPDRVPPGSAAAQPIPTTDLRLLQQLNDEVAELAARVKPAVVAVKTESVRKGSANPFAGTPFEDFFRGNPHFRMPGNGQRRIPGLGSGVLVSADGYILTNNHVVTGNGDDVADEISVEMVDQRTFAAKVVGRDPESDVAVLKIEASGLSALPYGDASKLRVGEFVMAVGNPFGQLHTVTTGIVSATGRGRVRLANYEDYIQTDAAINPGNSGGALVNARGELVGINTAILSQSGGYMGIGFAIPVDMARHIMEQLVEHGEVRRGLLGIEINDITPEVAEAMDLKSRQGVLVEGVLPDSPAEEAGVERGDVITEVDGTPMASASQLQNRVAMTAPGTRVELTLLRDGSEKTVPVKLAKRESEATPQAQRERGTGELGLRVQPLTPELAERLGYEGRDGVLIAEVASGSEAEGQGLQPGDIILEVDRKPVRSVAQFAEAVRQSKGTVLIVLWRDGHTRFVRVRRPRG